MGSSTTRNSSNEHEFFVAITSLNKIGERRIWDLTGDILFPVTFKCAILIVIRKDLRSYWCIYPITSWCVSRIVQIFLALGQKFWLLKWSPIERTDHFMSTLIDAAKTLEPASSIRRRPARRKNSSVTTLQKTAAKDRKHEFRSTKAGLSSHELKTRILYENLAFKASGHRVYHTLGR